MDNGTRKVNVVGDAIELLRAAIYGAQISIKGWEKQIEQIMASRQYARDYVAKKKGGGGGGGVGRGNYVRHNKPAVRKSLRPIHRPTKRNQHVVEERPKRSWSVAARKRQAARMRERWAARRTVAQ
jgi:hypothetical protein